MNIGNAIETTDGHRVTQIKTLRAVSPVQLANSHYLRLSTGKTMTTVRRLPSIDDLQIDSQTSAPFRPDISKWDLIFGKSPATEGKMDDSVGLGGRSAPALAGEAQKCLAHAVFEHTSGVKICPPKKCRHEALAGASRRSWHNRNSCRNG